MPQSSPDLHLIHEDEVDEHTMISQGPFPFAADTLMAAEGSAPPDAFGVTMAPATPSPPALPKSGAAPQGATVPVKTTGPQGPRFGLSTVLPKVEVHGQMPRLVHQQQQRYASVKPLGAGGVGDVFLVQDNDIDRQVAMKRLRAESTDLSSVVRFAEEIKTIGQLEHPSIIPIHDVGIDESGRYFFIMKYVNGETLESIIEKLRQGDPDTARRFSIEQRVALFTQLLRAVHFAHSRGFIHRDIKPANIMIGNFGEVIVMDWGLAKRVRTPEIAPPPPDDPPPASEGAAHDQPGAPPRFSTTRIGQLLGTPAYMSPEQASGDTDLVDERSDIYSLCVVFHELLTLRYYLANKTTIQSLLFGVMNEQPQDVFSGDLPGIPPELGFFLRRGLAKDPAQRYGAVSEMLEDLQRVSEGRFKVQCAFTGMRRASSDFSRMVRDRPNAALAAFTFLGLLTLLGCVQFVMLVLALF